VVDSLSDIKRKLSAKFLGKAGIHSFGISPVENAVRIYVDSELDDAFQHVLSEIEKEAAPYKVLVIQSDRSSIT
jgi:hypothetical protein